MSLYAPVITLLLVMDPLGNIPIFLSILDTVEERRRLVVLLRESLIAYGVLVLFLFFGHQMLKAMGLGTSALSISGGVILFLISIKMIFPKDERMQREGQIGEPLVVPLAIPLLAGPSAMATITLFVAQEPHQMFHWYLALTIACAISTGLLLFAVPLSKVLGKKGLVAVERFMGMLLTLIAVQMFLDGVKDFAKVIA